MDKKLLRIVLAAAAALLMIMGGGFFLMWTQIAAVAASIQEKTPGPDTLAPADPQKALGPLMAIEPLIVNLADEQGKRYLRVTMELEMEKPEMAEELKKRIAPVRNAILMVLPEKRFEDIRTTEGKAALKDEILAKINPMLSSGKITNIYYTEFVVQ